MKSYTAIGNRILTAKEKNLLRCDGDVYDELRDRFAMGEEVYIYMDMYVYMYL
jgi:hypothetical protein